MFDNRHEQKPPRELLDRFKQNFSDLCPPVATAGEENARRNSVPDAVAPHFPRDSMETDAINGMEETPRGLQDPWRFTPSMMDPNSVSFATAADQPPAYYAPTPGFLGIPYHNQAGDLLTPTLGTKFINPASTFNNVSIDAAPTINMSALQQPFMSHHSANHVEPFMQQPLGFTPNTFVHRHPGYDALDNHMQGSPVGGLRPNHVPEWLDNYKEFLDENGKFPDPPPELQNFRYQVTFYAPSGMLKDETEDPVTYLNKAHLYHLNITDTATPTLGPRPTKYRTYIRVAFEEEKHRAKPTAFWRMWIEGRGASEASQRDGKMLAIHHVDHDRVTNTRTQHVEPGTEALDGFCVTWSPGSMAETPSCHLRVTFNFLSTDFSHSKGVKGVPMRLCAKTEVVEYDNMETSLNSEPEMSFCKMKLFRDHGAERKINNDKAHVAKLIEKAEQQLAQVEMGIGLDKRKKSSANGKPAKVAKHNRSGSMNGEKPSMKDELHAKIAEYERQKRSDCAMSWLTLRGEPEDDPDVYPLPAVDYSTYNGLDDVPRHATGPESTKSQAMSPDSYSQASSVNDRVSSLQQSSFYDDSRHGSMDWSMVSHRDSDSGRRQSRIIDHPVKVQKVSTGGSNDGWFEAMDVDSTYQPPLNTSKKPSTCFYIQFRQTPGHESNDYYHAVYLVERTVKDLVKAISKKRHFDSSRISRVVCVPNNGINVIMDDDVVSQLPEGQDMVVEFSELSESNLEVNGDTNSSRASSVEPGVELKLFF